MVMVAEIEFRYLQTSLEINHFLVFGDGAARGVGTVNESTKYVRINDSSSVGDPGDRLYPLT